MLKKIAFFLIPLFLLFPLFTSVVSAQQGVQVAPNILPYPKPGAGTFLGQQHAYTVTLRGNGEAVVSARVSLTNNSETPLKEIELRMPLEIQTSDVMSFQVIREDKPCLRYSAQTSNNVGFMPPVCEQFGEPDYYQPYGQNKYQKAKAELSGDTIKITLPNPIASNSTGAFFVYFRGMGVTHKDLFGVYNFKFETLRVNDSIQNLTVGISTDSDLVLKGASGQVDYRFEDQSRNFSGLAAEKAVPSVAVDNFYSQIGYGDIVKTASSLAPLETYKVEGSYAVSKLGLYAKEIVIGILVVLIIIILGFILGKKFFGNIEAKKAEEVTAKPRSTFVAAFFVSLGGAVFVGLYTGALLLIGQLFGNMPYDWQYQQFVWLLMAVISFAVYAFLIISPAILMGVKKGIGWGFATLGLTIFWLLLLVFVFFGIMFLGNNKTPPTPVYPLQGSGTLERGLDTPQVTQ